MASLPTHRTSSRPIKAFEKHEKLDWLHYASIWPIPELRAKVEQWFSSDDIKQKHERAYLFCDFLLYCRNHDGQTLMESLLEFGHLRHAIYLIWTFFHPYLLVKEKPAQLMSAIATWIEKLKPNTHRLEHHQLNSSTFSIELLRFIHLINEEIPHSLFDHPKDTETVFLFFIHTLEDRESFEILLNLFPPYLLDKKDFTIGFSSNGAPLKGNLLNIAIELNSLGLLTALIDRLRHLIKFGPIEYSSMFFRSPVLFKVVQERLAQSVMYSASRTDEAGIRVFLDLTINLLESFERKAKLFSQLNRLLRLGDLDIATTQEAVQKTLFSFQQLYFNWLEFNEERMQLKKNQLERLIKKKKRHLLLHKMAYMARHTEKEILTLEFQNLKKTHASVIENLKHELDEMNAPLQDALEEEAKLAQDIEALSEEIKTMEQDCEAVERAHKDTFNKIQTELRDHEAMIQKLEVEIDAAKKARDKALDPLRADQSKLETLQSALKTQQIEHEHSLQKLSALEKEFFNATAETQAAEEELKRTRQALGVFRELYTVRGPRAIDSRVLLQPAYSTVSWQAKTSDKPAGTDPFSAAP